MRSLLDYIWSFFEVNLSVYITEKECNGTDIHITGGQTAFDGIVEICEDEVWVPVCDDKWDYRAATVVCRQLGYYGGIIIISDLTIIKD